MNKKKNYFFYFLFLFVFISHQLFLQNNLIFNNILIAEDYKFSIPNLVFGKIWYYKNSIMDVPNFAPHLCGGAPFFAEPQSMFYSFVQIIFIFFNLPTSIRLTYFIFSVAAYLGTFFLLKTSFKFNKFSSLIGSTIFLFNGFFINRALVGHLTHSYLTLIPFYCFLIIECSKINNSNLRNIIFIFSIFIFSSFFYSGVASMIPVVIYSIILIMLIYSVKVNKIKNLYYFFFSFFISIVFSISKISYSLHFLKEFPRNIEGTVLNNLYNLIYVFFSSLFVVPNPIYFDKHQHNLNKIYLSFHELQYGLSILPIILFLYYLFSKKKIFFIDSYKNNLIYKNLFILITVLLISPFFFLLQIPFLSDFFNKIPLFSAIWERPRWVFVFIIPIIIFCTNVLHRSNHTKKVLLFFILIPIIQIIATYHMINYFYPKKSFLNRATYNISSLTEFSNSINKENIDKIKIEYVRYENDFTKMSNEGLIKNTSEIFCYYPIFGYFLENLPRKSITIDDSFYFSTIKHDKNNYNLFNPSCFIFPKENNCQVGDLFSISEEKNVNNFTNYKPIIFKISIIQKIANYLSLITFLSLIICLFFFSYKFLKKFRSNRLLKSNF